MTKDQASLMNFYLFLITWATVCDALGVWS